MNRDEKGSNDDEELVFPAIATEKKGEIKGRKKKMYKNPNKEKICNHCKKKGTCGSFLLGKASR